MIEHRRTSDTTDRAFLLGARSGMVSRVLAVAAQLGATILLARFMSTPEYGALAVALSAVGLAALTTGHFAARTARTGTPAAARSFLPRAAVTGVVVGALTYLAGMLWPHVEIGQSLRWFSLVVALTPLLSVLVGSAAASISGLAIAAAEAARPVLKLFLVAGAVLLLGRLSPPDVAVVETMAVLGGIVLLAVILRARLREPTRHALADGTGAALALTVAGAVGFLVQRMDLLMIAALSGAESAARYDIGLRAMDLPLLVYASSLVTYVPILSRVEDGVPLRSQYRDATATGVVVVTPLVVGLGTWGDVGALLLFGERYALPLLVYAVLAGAVWVQVLSGPNGATLVGRHRHKVIMVVAAIQLASNLVLNLALIPTLGAVGAALATMTTYVIANIAMYRAVRHHVAGAVGARHWMPTAMGAVAAGTAISWLVRVLLGPTIAGLIAAALGASAVCIGVMAQDRSMRRRMGALLRTRPSQSPEAS